MHMYYVFLFTHLHVSVSLDHLQCAFCYIIYVIMCMSNIQAFIIIWSEGIILCYMLKYALCIGVRAVRCSRED
jgi:hypothetical protein